MQGSAVQARLWEVRLRNNCADAIERLNNHAPLSATGRKAYDEIARQLATGATDWAVTDGDTRKVLDILGGLSSDDWRAVINKMREGKDPSATLLAKLTGDGIGDDGTFQVDFNMQIEKHLKGDAEWSGISGYTSEASTLAEAFGVPPYEGDSELVHKVKSTLGGIIMGGGFR